MWASLSSASTRIDLATTAPCPALCGHASLFCIDWEVHAALSHFTPFSSFYPPYPPFQPCECSKRATPQFCAASCGPARGRISGKACLTTRRLGGCSKRPGMMVTSRLRSSTPQAATTTPRGCSSRCRESARCNFGFARMTFWMEEGCHQQLIIVEAGRQDGAHHITL